MANNELVRYWQSAAKLHLLNQRIFPREQLSYCTRFMPVSQIEKGLLDNWVGEQQDVYLAPFCFKQGADFSIPFWIEATLLPTGELQPRKPSALPWVLPAFLDSLSPQLPILSSVHLHDALLSEYFGTPDEAKVFDSWSSYYVQCLQFMTALHPNWKQEFIQTGFDLFDSAILLPVSAILTVTPSSSDLLDCYTNLEFSPSKTLPQFPVKPPILALAGLEPGDFLAIEHHQDVSLQQFFTEWVQYLFVQRALNKQLLPSVAMITSTNSKQPVPFELPADFAFSSFYSSRTLKQFIEIFKQQFFNDRFIDSQLTPEYMAAYIHELLNFNYQQYQDGMVLIQAYQDRLTQHLEQFGEQSLEEKIELLQARDAVLEQRYESLQAGKKALLNEFSTHFLGQIWQKFGQSKSRLINKRLAVLSSHLVLEESEINEIKNSSSVIEWLGLNLRKVQVERAKLQTEWVTLSEALVQRQAQWGRLLNWQKQNKLTLIADSSPLILPSQPQIFDKLHAYFTPLVFGLANLYWQAQQYSGVIFVCDILHQDLHKNFNLSRQKQIDYVFVLQANHFSPMLGYEFCSMAKRLVGLAGVKKLPTVILTPLQDTWLSRRHQLMQHLSESLLEETGALVSTGDAFQLISAHSVYEDSTYPGMGYTQLFYLDEAVSASPNRAPPKIDFHPIIGQMVPDRGSFINSLEADYLLRWLANDFQNNATSIIDIVIVTVFAAQKYYLQSLLDNSTIPVYTLREAMGKRAKCVIVSMVCASEGSLGPSIYDQNPLLLTEMIQMAEEKLVIFADPSIFALGHTTLGKFAQKVLTRTSEPNKDIIFASGL